MPVPVVDVSGWEVLELEATGRNSHPWLREANADQAWLFKPVVVKSEHRQGEEWSEYLASRVAGELGVPCAQIRLASRGDMEGCISRDLKPRRWQQQTGAVLLSGVIADYVSQDVRRRGHNLENIRTALTGGRRTSRPRRPTSRCLRRVHRLPGPRCGDRQPGPA